MPSVGKLPAFFSKPPPGKVLDGGKDPAGLGALRADGRERVAISTACRMGVAIEARNGRVDIRLKGMRLGTPFANGEIVNILNL